MVENLVPTYNILIVNDNHSEAFLTSLVLRKAFVTSEITWESSPKQALISLQNERSKPDFIFLDLDMAEMDGFSFLKEFEKINSCIQNPSRVIILSNLHEEHLQKARRNSTVCAFIQKPLGFDAVANDTELKVF